MEFEFVLLNHESECNCGLSKVQKILTLTDTSQNLLYQCCWQTNVQKELLKSQWEMIWGCPVYTSKFFNIHLVFKFINHCPFDIISFGANLSWEKQLVITQLGEFTPKLFKFSFLPYST